MEPGRQRAAIRLDATNCIFWNFRSPEKTCLFRLAMQAARGIVEVRGLSAPAQSQAAPDRHRLSLSPASLLRSPPTHHLTGLSFIHPGTIQ